MVLLGQLGAAASRLGGVRNTLKKATSSVSDALRKRRNQQKLVQARSRVLSKANRSPVSSPVRSPQSPVVSTTRLAGRAPARGVQGIPTRASVLEQFPGPNVPGSFGGPSQAPQPFNPLNASQSQLSSFLSNQANQAINPALDILGEQAQRQIASQQSLIDSLQGALPSRISELEALAQRQKDLAASRFDQQRQSVQKQASDAKEDLATRFAFSGFGQSSDHTGEQSDLAVQTQNLLSEINRAQLLEEARIDAEVRGASESELERINSMIFGAQQNISQLTGDLEQRKADLRLQALQTGQSSLQGVLEQQAEIAALEAERRAEFLKSQGLVEDPDTGERVDDIFAKADLFKRQAETERIKRQTELEGQSFGSQISDPQGRVFGQRRNLLTGEIELVPVMNPTTGEQLVIPPALRGRGGGGRRGGGGGGGASGSDINLLSQAVLDGRLGLLDVPSMTERRLVQEQVMSQAGSLFHPEQLVPPAPGFIGPRLPVKDFVSKKLDGPVFNFSFGNEPL